MFAKGLPHMWMSWVDYKMSGSFFWFIFWLFIFRYVLEQLIQGCVPNFGIFLSVHSDNGLIVKKFVFFGFLFVCL